MALASSPSLEIGLKHRSHKQWPMNQSWAILQKKWIGTKRQEVRPNVVLMLGFKIE